MDKSKEKKGLPADISSMSFEEALEELEKLVRRLEEGKTKLDEAVSVYERGVLLKRHCENKLREAQMRIEKINLSPAEGVSTAPLDF